MSNPFTPAFGVSPFVLAGRADLLDDMKAAFAAGVCVHRRYARVA